MSSENHGFTGNVELGAGIGMVIGNNWEEHLGGVVELDAPIPHQCHPMAGKESDTGRKHSPDEKPKRVGNKLTVILVYQIVIFLFFFGCGYGWFYPSSSSRIVFLPNVERTHR
jgi:hypothetical protein